MRYLSSSDASKLLSKIGAKEPSAVTKQGKICYFTLPPSELPEFRLFQRKKRIKESKKIALEMKQGIKPKIDFNDLP